MPDDRRPIHFPVMVSGLVVACSGAREARIHLKDGRRVRAILSDIAYPGDHVRGADLARAGVCDGRAYNVTQRKALTIEVLEVLEPEARRA